MQTSTIYKVTCKVTSKSYIGVTKFSPIDRWNRHIKNAKKLDTKLYRAIRKYGEDSFILETIVCNVPNMFRNAFEKYWIHFHNTLVGGYNMTIGGDGRSGYITSTITKEKLRVARTGKKHSAETCALLSKKLTGKIGPRLGSTQSEATRLKISKNSKSYLTKGKPRKKHTVETKKLISLKSKGNNARASVCNWWIKSPNGERLEMIGKSKKEYAESIGINPKSITNLFSRGAPSRGILKGYTCGKL